MSYQLDNVRMVAEPLNHVALGLVLCVRDGEITLTANSEAAPRALRRPANTWPHAPSPRRREEQRKRRAEGTLFKSSPG